MPVAGPLITESDVAAVSSAARMGWYSSAQEHQRWFEDAFSEYIGVRHAVFLPSCTAAIHLALTATRIGPGDEVIVPESTWIATAAPITYLGATPVFVDVDPVTWCMDTEAFEAAITPATRAVIPVDLYGGMPRMDRLRAIAAPRGIVVIEDAAEAIGASYDGRPAGAWGDIGVFSFHGSKTITTGEGGMLVTNRADIARRVRFLMDHGREPGDCSYRIEEVGFKYKPTAMQAALGLSQLRRVDDLLAKRRRIFGWYRYGLSGLPLTLNAEPDGTRNSYWFTTIILDNGDASLLAAHLRTCRIGTRPFFPPLSSIPAFGVGPGAPVAAGLATRGLNLPSALILEESDVAAVCTAVREWIS